MKKKKSYDCNCGTGIDRCNGCHFCCVIIHVVGNTMAHHDVN